jgi:hypothetical protein
MNESADGILEARKIVLRDSQGRVRLELASEAPEQSSRVVD